MIATKKNNSILLFLFINMAFATAQDSTVTNPKYSIFDYKEDGVLEIDSRDLELFMEFLSDTTQHKHQQGIGKLAIKGYPYNSFQPNIRLLNKLTRLKSLEFKAPFNVAYFPDSLWRFDSLTYFGIYLISNPVTLYGSTIQSPQLKDISLATARPTNNRNALIHGWDSITILKPEAFAHVEQFLCRGCDINALWDWLKKAPRLRVLRLTDPYIREWQSSANEFRNLQELQLLYGANCPIKTFDFRAKNLELLQINSLQKLPHKLTQTHVKKLVLTNMSISQHHQQPLYDYIRRKASHITKITIN